MYDKGSYFFISIIIRIFVLYNINLKQNKMSDFFTDEFKQLATPLFSSLHEILPLAKVQFDDKNELAKIEIVLPGFEKKNIEISVTDNNILNIEYKKSDDSKNNWDFDFEKSYHVIFDIDIDSIKAGFVNGILTIEFNGLNLDNPNISLVEID